MPSKNNFPLSGLSKQQKFILEYLEGSTILKPYRSTPISWAVAKKFDVKGNRIKRRQNRSEIIEEMKQEYLNEDTTPERKKLIEFDLNFMKKMRPSNLNSKILSKKHRTSVSRSLKRLIERGLIVKVVVMPKNNKYHLDMEVIVRTKDNRYYLPKGSEK